MTSRSAEVNLLDNVKKLEPDVANERSSSPKKDVKQDIENTLEEG